MSAGSLFGMVPVESEGSRLGQGEKMGGSAVTIKASASRELWSWDGPSEIFQIGEGVWRFITAPTSSIDQSFHVSCLRESVMLG